MKNSSPMIILCVEDDRDLAEVLREYFENETRVVQIATSGVDAIRRLDFIPHTDLACVVLDLRLPDMSGLDLVTAIRQRSPTVPIVLFSGHLSVRDTIEAFRKGVAEVFEKPTDLSALKDLVERICSRNSDVFYRVPGVDSIAFRKLCETSSISPREIEVIVHLLQGLSNREIADLLKIAETTVKAHIKHIFEKMQCPSRTALIARVHSECGATRFPKISS